MPHAVQSRLRPPRHAIIATSRHVGPQACGRPPAPPLRTTWPAQLRPPRPKFVRCWQLLEARGEALFPFSDGWLRENADRLQAMMCPHCFMLFADRIPGVHMGENRLIRKAQPVEHRRYEHTELPDPEPEEEQLPAAAAAAAAAAAPGGDRRRSRRHRGNAGGAGQPAAQPVLRTPSIRARSVPNAIYVPETSGWAVALFEHGSLTHSLTSTSQLSAQLRLSVLAASVLSITKRALYCVDVH
jgi:hypothetical protein